MIKSFDKYILKEVASPFGIGLLVYTFTLLINMIFLLSGTLIAKEASALTVVQILVYMLPDFLSFTIPMATLMGVLAGLSRMSTDSEILAFRTMGVNNFRILKPVLTFSLIAYLFSTWLIMYMAPEAGYRLVKLMGQIGIKRAVSSIKPGDFYNEFPYLTLYFNDVDQKTDEWKDVFIYSKKEGDTDNIILAKTGKFVQTQNERDSYFVLKNVEVHSFKRSEPQKSYRITYLKSRKERVPNPAEMKQMRKERQLIFPELIRRLKKEPENRQLAIEFHRKFSLPFACLALAFLALSLGISTRKGGKVSGFIISLGIIFIYYTASVTSENMVRKGVLPPAIGMWIADIFLLLTGIIMYYYSSREKSINWERLLLVADAMKRRFHRKPKDDRSVLVSVQIPRFHFRLLPIIDRYVIQRLVLSFFLVFTSLVMVFYIINFVELINDIVESGVSVSYIFQYLYYDTPEIISFVLPVASLTSVLLSFSVMSKNNEIVAVQVSGISLYRLTLPAIIIGLLLSMGFFHIQEAVMPGANKQKQEVLNLIRKIQIRPDEMTKNWVVGKNNVFYFYDFVDKDGNIINFNATYTDEHLAMKRRVFSKSARWENSHTLLLRDGFERDYQNSIPAHFAKFTDRRIAIEGSKDIFTNKVAFPKFMNIRTLKQYITYLAGKKSDTQKYEAQLFYKYAFPLSSLIMVLIAIPFSFLMGNKGTLFGIGIAVVISIVFWFTFAVSSALGSSGILSPFISAFAPIFIFTAVSIYLFIHIKT
ncbi:MAG: LPS export ABC transporter permease LptF [Candidatus Omnitrophota bacterium]